MSTEPKLDFLRWPLAAGIAAIFLAPASCSSDSGGDGTRAFGGSGATVSTGGSAGSGQGGSVPDGGIGGTGGSGTGGLIGMGGQGMGGAPILGDPKTCEEAAMERTYVGCDFWPTVTSNNVWSIFDFAVVVANAGDDVADVTVTRDGAEVATAQVNPNGLSKIYLPWVDELKGPDFDCATRAVAITQSLWAPKGAYHLTSSVPVTVYQFNALEYQPAGGPQGKDWSSCPGSQACMVMGMPITPVGCFSYSNDASLLLPTTALTGNYRVTGFPGWINADIPSFYAITATEDGTEVTLQVSPTSSIVGAGPLADTAAGGVTTLMMDAGDVIEVIGATTDDPSGTLVQADKPVQVITGLPCTQVPHGIAACDHIEESVLPAETLGKRYFVIPPSPPGVPLAPLGQGVRLYGNVNGTQLTYPSGPPPTAPTTINAGQVIDLGIVSVPFEVVGDNEFGVSTFQQGASIVDPLSPVSRGDPSQSLWAGVEQYRLKYVFLAPDDYPLNFADIVQPMSAQVIIDGTAAPPPTPIGSSGFGVTRVALGLGANGAHVLISDLPVGLQVVGYGDFTSYQYPGGLNLRRIAPPPPPVR